MIAAVVWEDDDSFSGQSVCLKNSQQVIVWLFIAVMPDAVIPVDVFGRSCTVLDCVIISYMLKY